MGDEDARLSTLSVAELVASLSLATDVGTGFPLEHALRSCLLATWTAEACGVTSAALQDVFYVALLKWVGCTATAANSAAVLGDEFGMGSWFATVDLGNQAEVMGAVGSNLGEGLPDQVKADMFGRLMNSPLLMVENMAEHCEVGRLLASELGLSEGVTLSLSQAFARWNGTGVPIGLAGDYIEMPIRVALVTEEAERYARVRGAADAVQMVRERAGNSYDPETAAVFVAHGEDWLSRLDGLDCWVEVLAAEPSPARTLRGAEIDRALGAVADFTDLKSPHLVGHSRAVARLAGLAAAAAGLPADDVVAVGRAGLIHDVGRVAVSSRIWGKAGTLSSGEWERVRLHPYYTDRFLARATQLTELRHIASLHHERLDGSGYHGGVSSAGQSTGARILAAADVYSALTEDRPHRPAVASVEAAIALRSEVRAGRLDRAAAEAVLVAAGAGGSSRRAIRVADLTPREVEVLRAVARGRTTREVAAQLFISPKTADNHVQHIYEKIQVGTRAGATLFAMQHGLIELP